MYLEIKVDSSYVTNVTSMMYGSVELCLANGQGVEQYLLLGGNGRLVISMMLVSVGSQRIYRDIPRLRTF